MTDDLERLKAVFGDAYEELDGINNQMSRSDMLGAEVFIMRKQTHEHFVQVIRRMRDFELVLDEITRLGN